jgi:hypothetical protein
VSGRPASEDREDKVSQFPFRRGARKDAELGEFEDGDIKIKEMRTEKENADGFFVLANEEGVRGRFSEIDDTINERLDFRPRWKGSFREFNDRTAIFPPVFSLGWGEHLNDGGEASEEFP